MLDEGNEDIMDVSVENDENVDMQISTKENS